MNIAKFRKDLEELVEKHGISTEAQMEPWLLADHIATNVKELIQTVKCRDERLNSGKKL